MGKTPQKARALSTMVAKKPKRKNREREIQTACSNWFRARHPNTKFVNMPDDFRKTMNWQYGDSFPDMVIYKPTKKYHALFIEFKRSKDLVFRKDGQLRQDKQIKKQIKCMKELIQDGYACYFCWSLSQFIQIVSFYFNEGKKEEPPF